MLLMEEAERIAVEEHGSGKIAVISGEGLVDTSYSSYCFYRIIYEIQNRILIELVPYVAKSQT